MLPTVSIIYLAFDQGLFVLTCSTLVFPFHFQTDKKGFAEDCAEALAGLDEGDDDFRGKTCCLYFVFGFTTCLVILLVHVMPMLYVVVNPGEEYPDYLVNSLVDIDGGTGRNRLTIVGTEAGDT